MLTKIILLGEVVFPYFQIGRFEGEGVLKGGGFLVNYWDIKWLLSIEILTFRDFGVISWVTSHWNILKWHLSDQLIRLLKWQYGA